jgi:hypothetical protein
MTEPRHSGEYHHADPAYRKQMLALLVACIVIGGIFLFALQQWLSHLSATVGGSDPYRMLVWLQRILAGVCLLLAASGFGLAVYVHRVGKQVRLERRWPPSAMRTTRDVRIRYLTSADALVSQLMFLAAALVLFSLVVMGYGFWLLRPG